MNKKIELFKNYLKDSFYESGENHRIITLSDYLEIMNKYNDYNYILNDSIENQITFFENVILKDLTYLNISVQDECLMENVLIHFNLI